MSYRSECLHPPVDFEPLCKDYFPDEAIGIAEDILKSETNPTIICALGLIIPNLLDQKRILYAKRDPKTNIEFPNSWGLPSISITKKELLSLGDGEGNMLMPKSQPLVDRISINKLQKIVLEPDKFQAWTGRYRSSSDPRFNQTYYLIMVDISTKPIEPRQLPLRTSQYSNFAWLTPEEHKQLVSQTDMQACGACSQITHLLSENGNL